MAAVQLVGCSASEALGAHTYYRATFAAPWGSVSSFPGYLRIVYDNMQSTGLVRPVSNLPSLPGSSVAPIDVTALTGASSRSVGEAADALHALHPFVNLERFARVTAAEAVGSQAAKSRQEEQDRGNAAHANDGPLDETKSLLGTLKNLAYLILIVALVLGLAYLATEAKPLLRILKK